MALDNSPEALRVKIGIEIRIFGKTILHPEAFGYDLRRLLRANERACKNEIGEYLELCEDFRLARDAVTAFAGERTIGVASVPFFAVRGNAVTQEVELHVSRMR